MLRDPTGLPTWAGLPQGFEDCYDDGGDSLGLLGFGFAAPCIPDSSEFYLRPSPSPSQGVSQSSYDISSASSSSSSSTTTTTLDTDVSLSSYLMDGNVRAMLKKVTVNEGTLNQAIQSLGGGEKGLKELMGHIMSWVREHQNGSSEDTFSLSQNLKNLHKSPPSAGDLPTPPKLLHRPLDETTLNDSSQCYQPCTKSRRLDEGAGDHSSSSGATFVNVSGSVANEFQYSKPQPSMGSYNTGIGPMMSPEIRHPQQHQHQQHQQANPSPAFFSFAPRHDDFSRMVAANTTRAARRNRIARQRQQSLPSSSNRTASAPAPAVSWATASPSPSAPDCRTPDRFLAGASPVAAVVPGRRVNNADMLTFVLQKELRPSDVGSLGRIILPKKEAEMYLPTLALREGVALQMEDFDSGVCWNIRYRFWPNNKSRMYLLESTGEFVKHHRLQEGDHIILYRNQQGTYVLRGKKNPLSESKEGAERIQQKNAQKIAQKNAHSLARRVPEVTKTEDVLKESDFELRDWSCQKVGKERGFGMEFEDRKAAKAEPVLLVGDDDPFFKEDVMHNISSSVGSGMLQPLERFPSLYLDSQFDEIMAGLSKDDPEIEPKLPKTEPA